MEKFYFFLRNIRPSELLSIVKNKNFVALSFSSIWIQISNGIQKIHHLKKKGIRNDPTKLLGAKYIIINSEIMRLELSLGALRFILPSNLNNPQ